MEFREVEQAPVMPSVGEEGGRAMFAWLREMRDRWPVWKDAMGFWGVFRYADVEHAASDPEVFSSDTTAAIPGMERLQRGTLTRMDPPEHHQLRRLISQSFTPKRVAGLAPRIAEIASALLDQASGSDRLDLVSQFAYPLPVTVIAELLGVPVADRELFHRWADHLLSRSEERRVGKECRCRWQWIQ